MWIIKKNVIICNEINLIQRGEIRWDGSTKYSTELTQAIKDKTVENIERNENRWEAYYQPKIDSADYIFINTTLLAESHYTSEAITSILRHELGHSIEIGDHYTSKYLNDAVMYGVTFDDAKTNILRSLSITAHDIEDYNKIEY